MATRTTAADDLASSLVPCPQVGHLDRRIGSAPHVGQLSGSSILHLGSVLGSNDMRK